MNIINVLIMNNDFERLDKCLKSFREFNDIPVLVYNNGGESPKFITEKYKDVIVEDIPNIWNSGHSYSFDYRWFEYIFKVGFNYDYLLFFETDALTLRKLEETDLLDFDFYGRFGRCGPNEQFLYDYFNLKEPHIHSCAGATIFRRSYFEKCKYNLKSIEEYFNKYRCNFYHDLAATFLGRISNCSFTYWNDCIAQNETSDAYENGQYFKLTSNNPVFIHPYKL